MIQPTPAGDRVSDLVARWRAPTTLTRRCRDCGAVFRTDWNPRWYCDDCCRKLGPSQQPRRYRVPPEFAPHALATSVADAARESWLLVLTGKTGVGKTCQAHWLLASEPADDALFAQSGSLGWDWHTAEVRQRLLAVRSLAIDDVGRRMTDGVTEALCQILDARGAHRMRTILTTNLDQQQLAEAHPPLASRISAGRWLRIGGQDRRAAR